MKRLLVRTGFVVLLLSAKSHAQSGAVIPHADGGSASQGSCVILERMGRGDRTKSRLYSLGISGKHFRLIEGKLPEGFSSHGKMTDHDVRNLQARGAQVLVLDSHYTSADLKEARANCAGQTGQTLTQAETKAPPEPAPALLASTPSPATKPLTGKPPDAKAPTAKAEDSAASAGTAETATSTPAPASKLPAPKAGTPKAATPKADGLVASTGATEAALVDVSSTPPGADVYIDERFFGQTPATTIILMPGNHTIAVRKSGFVPWQKKLNLPSGRTNVDAALIPKAK